MVVKRIDEKMCIKEIMRMGGRMFGGERQPKYVSSQYCTDSDIQHAVRYVRHYLPISINRIFREIEHQAV